MDRIEGTTDVDKSSNQKFFVVEGMVNMSGENRHSRLPLPLRKANKLSNKIAFDSSHQSRRDLSMRSKILHKAEDKAIGRKEVEELDLGIGMTRKEDQDEGRCWVINNWLKIQSRTSRA